MQKPRNTTTGLTYARLALTSMLLLTFVVTASAGDADKKKTTDGKNHHTAENPGLLVLSHGAPGQEWNKPVLDLVEKVRQENKAGKPFHAIEAAFLEFARPDASEAVEKIGRAHV